MTGATKGQRRVFREGDNWWGQKVNAFIQRNAGLFVIMTPLMSVVVAIVVMMGFSAVTPQVNFARLAKMDSLLASRIDSTANALARHVDDSARDRQELRLYVESLLIGQCITRPDPDLMRMRLLRFCSTERGSK